MAYQDYNTGYIQNTPQPQQQPSYVQPNMQQQQQFPKEANQPHLVSIPGRLGGGSFYSTHLRTPTSYEDAFKRMNSGLTPDQFKQQQSQPWKNWAQRPRQNTIFDDEDYA